MTIYRTIIKICFTTHSCVVQSNSLNGSNGSLYEKADGKNMALSLTFGRNDDVVATGIDVVEAFGFGVFHN